MSNLFKPQPPASASADDAPVASSKRRGVLPVLFWCSVVYLIVELAFSAQLLVMAGSLITPEELDSIETVGRSLSGIAVTLFLISGLVKARLPKRTKAVGIALVTAVTIATVWIVQELVIIGLTKAMSEDQLDRAMVLARSTALIRDGHIAIPTMDLSPEALARPSGLSFMAMFPALALSRESIDDELRPLLPAALTRALVLSCDGPVPCLGTPDQFVTDFWPPMQEELAAYYAQYDEARRPAYNPTQAMVRDEAQKAWRDYNRNMQRRGLDHTTRHHARVRAQLRAQGLNVPNNWRLNDYDGFERAVRQRIIRVARDKFGQGISIKFGHRDFPYDLTEGEFFAHRVTQRQIWAEEGLSWSEFDRDRPPRLTTVYSESQLQQNLYPALIDFYAKRDFDNLFRDQHRRGERAWKRQAHQAAEGLVAVPLALGFSIIGALTHIAKVLGYLFGLFLPRRLAISIPSAGVVIAAVVMYATPNVITDTPSYKAFEASTTEAMGPVVGHGLRFVIHAEHRLFPMNNWIHQVVLRDFDFAQF